jgi:hypothetical protein
MSTADVAALYHQREKEEGLYDLGSFIFSLFFFYFLFFLEIIDSLFVSDSSVLAAFLPSSFTCVGWSLPYIRTTQCSGVSSPVLCIIL